MRTSFITIAALLTVVALASGAQTPPSDSKLTVDGVFTITAPQGYAWNTLNEFSPTAPGVYLAAKEGSDTKLVVIVEPRQADTDAKRVAILKAHVNAMADTLQKAGLKDLKGERPNIKPPIADTSDYWFSGTAADGASKFFHGHTKFGKNTFQVQAAGTEQEAKQLITAAKTLTEPAGASKSTPPAP